MIREVLISPYDIVSRYVTLIQGANTVSYLKLHGEEVRVPYDSTRYCICIINKGKGKGQKGTVTL